MSSASSSNQTSSRSAFGTVLSMIGTFLISIVSASALSTPTNHLVTFTLADSTSMVLNSSWTDTSDPEYGFQFGYLVNTMDPVAVAPFILTQINQSNISNAQFTLPINAFPVRPPDTYFFLFVRGVSSASNPTYTAWSNVTGFVWPNPPVPTFSAPTGLSHSFPATNVLRLSFTDNSNSEQLTEILAKDRSLVTNPFVSLGSINFNQTTVDLFYYLQPGKSYDVKVRMRNFAGSYTGDSNVITVNVPGTINETPPLAPSNTSVAANITNSVNQYGLYWDDNSADETGYEIQEKASGALDSTYVSLGVLNGVTGVNRGIGLNLANSYVINGSRDFRLRALRGNGPFAVASSFTPNTGATMATFNAPTDLRATAPSDNGKIQIFWSDNATAEEGYEIEYRIGTTGAFLTLGTYSSTDFSRYQINGGLEGFPPSSTVQLRVRAKRTASPTTTDYSNEATVNTPPLTAPTGLTATLLGEQTVKFDWIDNSGGEQGYIVQARFLPSGNFFDIAGTAVNAQTATVTAPNLPYPGLGYEFRVLAAYDPDGTGPLSVILSSPSNLVTANLAFNAPTSLTANLVNETSVNFTWVDNSSVETKYSVLIRRVGSTTWGLLADTAANATSYSTNLLFPGTAYEFAVVGVFVRATNDVVETALSNLATVTTPFIAPTNLQLQSGSLTETQAVLTWTDNSSGEQGYEVLSRPAGSTNAPTTFGFLNANATSITAPLTPGTSSEFFVRAYYVRTSTSGDVALTSNSNGVTLTAKDAVTSPVYVELPKDVPMTTYTLTQSAGSALVTRSVTNLPAGLTFDSNAGTVTGTPTTGGLVQSNVTLTFANGWTHTNKLVFRVLLPPVVASFPSQSISLGTPATISLIGKFTDPDAASAARVNTNLTVNGGNMDFILFDAATPLHVANFMGYANRGDYVNTVFHRTIPGFITQGGAFRADTAPTAFLAVPTQAQVTNEPGISNVRGTVALAKLPSGPSTGTNQFFVNLANNGPNLDFQNGGFTAFGRVTAPGMAVADAMAALPTGDYNVTIGGSANSFEDFPFNAATAPATMNNTQAVRINSVTALPVLSYSLVSNSNPSIATASISGTNLSLTPVAIGSTQVVIRATDLEGLTVDHSVTVTVNGTFAAWATSEALPTGQEGMLDDADQDGTTNLSEWAFLSNPKSASASELGYPTPGLNPSGDPTGRIQFKARKFAAGLTFIVQASESLTSNEWVDIWNSSTDGFASPRVTVDQDNADHRLLTVTDTETIATGAPRRFLRIKLLHTP